MAEYKEKGDNAEFCSQLRQEYADDEAGWKPIRDEGRTDIRYIAGDAWEPADRQERLNNHRLCLSFDEFSQYTNQLINDSLQNKRAIKVTANGNGADDKEAELRANRIRQIEYESNAQQAYTTAFENAVQRSYGWVRINTRFVKGNTGDKKIVIEAVPNPDMITPGPHITQDGSDIKRLWFKEWWSHAEFKAKLRYFPDAKIRDLSSSAWQDEAPAWISDRRVLICEYWVKKEDGSVCQYLTNGLEVLLKSEWAGHHIPFVPCYGKVLFTSDGGKTERQIHSLIRLAREPFKAYCYVRTCEAELIAQMPKFPYFAYRGSLVDTELQSLMKSVHEPVAVIQVESIVEGLAQSGPPPFPQRNPYDPSALAALDQTAEAFRRAIQAAIGQSALPTQAQRRNEKSGVALKQIEDSGQRGSFHYIAHYEGMITRVGLINDDLLGPIHDNARDMTVRRPDDTTQVLRINEDSVDPETNESVHYRFTDAEFDITISTGPQNDSEREAQSDFADLLLQSPEIAQIIGPQNMQKVLAKVIKLKNVGPLGDAIADIIDPPQQDGQVDPQQQQQKMAAMGQAVDTLTKELDAKNHVIETDQIKADNALKLQDMKHQHDLELQRMKDATSMKVAAIAAQSKGITVAMEADEEALALGAEQQHEADQAELDRQHEAQMAQMQHAQTMQAGAQDGEQQAQQSAQDHGEAMEQGQAGHEQNLEAGAQAAALAPQPEAGA